MKQLGISIMAATLAAGALGGCGGTAKAASKSVAYVESKPCRAAVANVTRLMDRVTDKASTGDLSDTDIPPFARQIKKQNDAITTECGRQTIAAYADLNYQLGLVTLPGALCDGDGCNSPTVEKAANAAMNNAYDSAAKLDATATSTK